MSESKSPPKRGYDLFTLRLPPGMREKIVAAAEAHGRSVHQEVLFRLSASFERPLERPGQADLWAADALLRMLSDLPPDEVRHIFYGSRFSMAADKSKGASNFGALEPDRKID